MGGTLFITPSVTEFNQDVSQTQFVKVWTGTNSQGTFQSACGNAWVSTGGEAHHGLATSMSSTSVFASSTGCGQATNRLYCLGVDRAVRVQ